MTALLLLKTLARQGLLPRIVQLDTIDSIRYDTENATGTEMVELGFHVWSESMWHFLYKGQVSNLSECFCLNIFY